MAKAHEAVLDVDDRDRAGKQVVDLLRGQLAEAARDPSASMDDDDWCAVRGRTVFFFAFN
jgi:hypothetical protein